MPEQIESHENAQVAISQPTRRKVEFQEIVVSGWRTGALDIAVQGRRVISVPTQLGCTVGCTFCISSQAPLVRNLTLQEMTEMVNACLVAHPPDGRPIELSFTGEGEALLNWRECTRLVESLPALSTDFQSVRYCFSGIGARQLLARVGTGAYPVRIQFSLHCARPLLRSQLIPKSAPLEDVRLALQANESRFKAIELNVVLQDGVNDSDADLEALCQWGSLHWPIVLSPLLQDGMERIGRRTDEFEAVLRAHGRLVKRYRAVAADISRQRIYPLLRSRNPG